MAGCPSCGRENHADARFCSNCGTALAATAPAREQRKVVTILFCDLVGSTALGESTDPEALRARMRRYFEDLRAIVERHGGTVEKFVGDAVMAVFGIPIAHEDDALRAVRAAAEMREAIALHGLEARIGVNTGEVVVGGEGETLVTGDAVNVAARLEQTAAAGDILLGAGTRALVRDAVVAEAVEPLALKGKSAPVEAYRLLELSAEAPVRPRTPLVGRERERQRLWRDYEDAVADRTCRLFTLLGPAGIGKSRLVADFLERVGDSADVLRGRCLSYGEGITYWPLVEMLRPIGIDAQSVVASTPEETRAAFRKLLEARAVERPQVVVVDDLQWAEPTFVELVEHVADFSRGAPAFLLCVARTELLDAYPAWGGGKLNATSLQLEPLDVAACELLMENLLGTAELDPELRERIAVTSGGNALYVEEMVALVREPDGPGDIAVPPTIQALLQARIDGLDDDLRVVLERAAIEGEVFRRDVVAELVPSRLRPHLDAQLASLLRKELVRPEPHDGAYRFRHLLIREAVYAAMPKDVRAGLHAQFAEWLEESVAPSAFELDEVVGYHLEQAARLRADLGDDSAELQHLRRRAATRLASAGRVAFERVDARAAISLFQRAADLLPPGDPVRTDALTRLGRALMWSADLERARSVLESVDREACLAGDTRAQAYAQLELGDLVSRVDPESTAELGLELSVALAAELERIGDPETLGVAYCAIGMCRFVLGHAADGAAELERAAELARRAGSMSGERTALAGLLRPTLWGPRPASEGLRVCQELLERDDLRLRVAASQVLSVFAAMTGDAERARTAGADAFSVAEELGLGLQRALSTLDVGYAYAVLDDLAGAERELRRGHSQLAAAGETGVRASLTPVLASVLHRQGRDDEAMLFAEESRSIAAPDDFDAQVRWRSALARIVAAKGDLVEGERLAREAVAVIAPTDFVPLQADAHDALGEVLLRADRPHEAAKAFGRAAELHEQKGNVVSAARSREALAALKQPS